MIPIIMQACLYHVILFKLLVSHKWLYTKTPSGIESNGRFLLSSSRRDTQTLALVVSRLSLSLFLFFLFLYNIHMTSLAELRQRLLHRYYVLHLMYGCGYLYVSFKRLRDPNVEFTVSSAMARVRSLSVFTRLTFSTPCARAMILTRFALGC